jgi:hypothetical protein
MRLRRRFAGVVGLVAMVLALAVICPCAPPMSAATSADPHACCAGKAGFNVARAAPSCCSENGEDGQPAVPSVSLALVAGWGTLDAVTIAAPAPPALPASVDFSPPSAAPLILRV